MKKNQTLFFAVLLLIGLAAVPAHAQSFSPFADLRSGGLSELDLAPSQYDPWLSPAASSSGAQVMLSLSSRQRSERNDYSAGIQFSVPTDWLAGVAAPTKSASLQPLQAPAPPFSAASSSPTKERPVAKRKPVPPVSSLPRVRADDVRAVADAAMAAWGYVAASEELESLASRARWSALLPNLRLRATRQVDEDTALSPASYDPDRITSSTGMSLWLEARMSWQLDRLLFGSQEVGIHKLQQAIDRDRRKHSQQAVALLLAWQQAVYLARDPLTEPNRCLSSWFEEQQFSAELDGLTAGWHSDWLARKKPLPQPWCVVELIERVAP